MNSVTGGCTFALSCRRYAVTLQNIANGLMGDLTAEIGERAPTNSVNPSCAI